MIKVVLFDLGGVITKTKFDEMISKYGGKYDWELDKLKDKIFGEEYFSLLRGEIELEEFIDWLNNQSNSVDQEEIEEFVEEYYYSEVVRKDIKRILKELLEKGLKLALITNDIGQLDDKLKALDLNNIFNYIINSYQVGYCKPDIEIYEYALKIFDIIGEECLYIDNSSDALKTAASLNMHTLLYQNEVTLINDLVNLKLI